MKRTLSTVHILAPFMSPHAFDPASFMNNTYTEKSADKPLNIPPGEYPAMITKCAASVTNDGKAKMDITWSIDDANVKTAVKRDVVTTRQTVWLDIDDSGQLQFGEGVNVQLGKVRTAVGQNNGSAWSPSMLLNQVAKIKVTQRADKDDPNTMYDNVVAVTALG